MSLTQDRIATAPLVYPAAQMGAYTQEASLIVWSSVIEQAPRGTVVARPDVRCTVGDLKVWGTAVRFSYAVNNA